MLGIYTSRNTFVDGRWVPLQCGREFSSDGLIFEAASQSGGVYTQRSASATLYGLQVSTKSAPGIGNSYTFEVYYASFDGSAGSEIPIASGVSVTISGASTSGQSSTFLRVDPGSMFAIKMTASGSPSSTTFSSCVTLESNAAFTYLLGPNFSYPPAVSPAIFNLDGFEYPVSAEGRVFPCDGYVHVYILERSVGDNGFLTFLLYKNGIQKSLDKIYGQFVVGIFGKAYADLYVSGIVLGDVLKLGFQNDYAWLVHGICSSKFTPNTAKAFPLMGGFLGSGLNSTRYISVCADGVAPGTDEDDFTVPMPQCSLSNLSIFCSSVLGTSRSLSVTVRKNKIDTSLTATVQGNFIRTAADLSNSVSFSAGDLLSLKLVPSGNPAPGFVLVGIQAIAGSTSTVQQGYAVIKNQPGSNQTGYAVIAPHKTTTQTGYAVIDTPSPGPHAILQLGYAVLAPHKTTTQTGYAVISRPEQSGKGRVHALLNSGNFWDGAWLCYDNGVVGPAPSGSFLPTDDPALFAWFRSDRGLVTASTGLIATGSAVWKDQSGRGLDMETTAGKEPSFVASATPSGKPAVSFPGGVQKFIRMPATVVGMAQPLTHFLLLKPIAWTANAYICDGPDAGHRAACYMETGTPKISGYAGNAMPDNSDLSLGNWHVLTFIYDGASSAIQVDNNADVTGNAGTLPGVRMIYGDGVGGIAWAQYYLAASIIVNAHVSSDMRANHKQWLADYAGIVL